MIKKIILLAVLLPAFSAFAGDLTVDNLSVDQDASFYGAVHAYVPGGDVSMGPFTNQYGGSGTNPPSLMPGLNPIGDIHMFAASNAPSGWLLCNGAAVSRTTYSNLFTVIGATYGAGDGTTTFNLPNLQQRFPLGSTNSLGVTGGYENVTLTSNQIPSHTHDQSPATRMDMYSASQYRCWVGRTMLDEYSNTEGGGRAVAATDATGGGQSHSNMPPYLKVNFIIYAGQ